MRRSIAAVATTSVLLGFLPCHATSDEIPCQDATEVLAPQIERLRQPLRLTERHPLLLHFMRLWVADPEPHRDAIRALGEFRSRRAVPDLVAVLGNPDFPYRTDAARALGLLRDESSAAVLLASMADGDPGIREAAASSVGSLLGRGSMDTETEEQAISALKRMLAADPDSRVRFAAYKGLLGAGGPRLLFEALNLAAHNSDRSLRCAYIRDRAPLARLVSDPDIWQNARNALLAVLDEPDSSDCIEKLLRPYRVSHERCTSIRTEAVVGLGSLGTSAIVPRLVEAVVADPDGAYRAATATALGKIGGEQAVTALITALSVDPLPAVRQAAAVALARTDDARAAVAFADVLAHGGTHDRIHAALALADRPAHAPVAVLVSALGDPSAQLRRAAASALLGLRARSEAEFHLIQALSAPDERLRRGAALVLSRYDSAASRELLLRVLREAQEPSAGLAAFALGLRAEPASREGLESALLDSSFPDPLAVIHALQDLGEKESISTLRAYVRRGATPRTKSVAELAIAILGSSEPAPNALRTRKAPEGRWA